MVCELLDTSVDYFRRITEGLVKVQIMKTSVLFNANAGAAGNSERVYHRCMALSQCDFRATYDADDVGQQVRSAIDQGAKRIIVAGGDGTVSQVIDELADDFTQADLAILPLGTGNDLARSLGIPLDNIDAALSLAHSGVSIPVDVVRVFDGKTSYLINAASAGFGGQVAVNISATDKARWGAFAYWMTAVTEIVNLPQFDIHVKLDDRSFDSRVYGLTIANGRYLGGGFPIAREAFVNDGLIDVTVIPVLPALELLAAGLNYMMGISSGGNRLLNFRAKRVQVTSTPEMLFSIDGDPVREVDATFEVLPQALRIVAGPQAPAFSNDFSSGAIVLPKGPASSDSMQAIG